jgi:hypothetical protein
MHELTEDERRLFGHYCERERVISGLQRTQAHLRLLDLGYIKEQAVNIQDLLITVTDVGRRYAEQDDGTT